MHESHAWVQDAELIEYLSESSVMSKTVEEYGARKSSAITTARRLAQFLGDGRLKDKGLVCNYITAWCVFNLLLRVLERGAWREVWERPCQGTLQGL